MKCQWSACVSDWFKKIIRGVVGEIEYIRVTATLDGLEFQAINQAYTSLVRINVTAAQMESYESQNLSPFYINVGAFSLLCKTAMGTSSGWDVDNARIMLSFGNMLFRIPMIDIDEDRLEIPEHVQFNITIPAAADPGGVGISELMECANAIKCENIKICAYANRPNLLEVGLKGEGDLEATAALSARINPPADQTYSLQAKLFILYMKLVLGSMSSPKCSIQEGQPFGISANAMAGENVLNGCVFQAFIAPRIDDD